MLRVRLAAVGVVLGLLFLIVLFRLWYLQVLNGAYYGDLARGNRIRVLPQEAPRGIIYDRNGVILAFNRPAFNIQLVPEDTRDLAGSLRNLSRLTLVPYAQLMSTLEKNKSSRKFIPAVLLKDIGRKKADLVDTYQEDLPGISVAIESKRLYPTAFLSSHVIGYVGAINEAQLKRLPISRLYSGRIVGQSGVEARLNEALIGQDGGKQVEVDNVGRELRVLGQPVNPIPGNDIWLTLDLRLQRFVRSTMAGKSGVVMVMKPRTGEILGLTSFPDYDPNLFVGGIRGVHWDTLTGGKKKPLINKATQGLYPPGSTFKMVLGVAGLDQRLIGPKSTYNCPGYLRLNREIYYCWNRSGHGEVNLEQALAQSCNVFFYTLGLELGVDRISDYAAGFGFGKITRVELDSEKKGLLPSKAWKERTLKERWYPGETVPVAIGQGYLNVTPIQLAAYVNIIANRGLWVQPTILRRVVTAEGVQRLSQRDLPRSSRTLPVPAAYFDVIRRGMIAAVEQGTAKRARSEHFTIAGKTGTSQVVGRVRGREPGVEIEERFRPHALFVGFAPAENPQVSIVVLVEHGGSGGRAAAPLAKKILEFYAQTIEPFPRQLPQIEDDSDSAWRFRQKLHEAFLPPHAGAPKAARPLFAEN